MANLKELKTRIGSVKSTQKITKAMKMVAASKLRRAQERAEAARPFSEKMERMLNTLATKADTQSASPLLVGRRDDAGEVVDNIHLLVVATADRGLCGGFNSSIVKKARLEIAALVKAGKQVKIVTLGKKAYEQLKTEHGDKVIERYDFDGKAPEFEQAQAAANRVLSEFDGGKVDSASLIFNTFVSPLQQDVTHQSLIPLEIKQADNDNEDDSSAAYEYEPSEEAILSDLLPRNIAVQIFAGLLENAASEQGARMTAMDNATTNAAEMINKLTLVYNRTRQAAITTELTEIISGAEAL